MSTETPELTEAPEATPASDDAGRGPRPVETADELIRRATHDGVHLPSGAIVSIKLPNLAAMVESETLPNDLIEQAIEHQNISKEDAEKMTVEQRKTLMKETWAFIRFIVPRTLAKPTVTEEQVPELDPMDLELLAAFAARRTDIDAVGHQLGGLDTQDSFRRHRGIFDINEVVGDFTGSGEAIPEAE